MSKSNVITLQGKDFTTYEGLLDQAHQEGLCRISTSIVQIPTPDNGNMAVVLAEVETGKGVFSGIGDANPGNVNRMILPHVLRMAETRAKARALRDAVNVGVTSVEEMADSPEQGHGSDGHGETVREERAPAKSDGNLRLAGGAKKPAPEGDQGAAPVALLRVKVAELAGLVDLDNAEIVTQVKAQTGVDLRAQNDPPSRMKALDWLEGQIAMQTLARESQRA